MPNPNGKLLQKQTLYFSTPQAEANGIQTFPNATSETGSDGPQLEQVSIAIRQGRRAG
ncbi:hypothetical protein [Belnapia moabensis]|uniref:hypothetical protein n=1 Tax=Belnapia moabensis TaxID=365533 RepID=UPI0012EDE34F|nr:hypothetical protein [Belnapia moabensis]